MERGGGRLRLRLAGELDLATAPEAERVLEEAIDGGPVPVELDLSGLTFVDSTGLRLIVQTHQRCVARGCALSLVPGPRGVQRVFDVAGVLDLLPFVGADGAAQPEADTGGSSSLSVG